MNKRYLLYGGVGVVILIAIYYATKSPDVPILDDDVVDESSSTTSTGKTQEQITLDPKLVSLMQQKDWIKTINGKNIYSKLDNVKVRNSEYINDGKISNLYGTVPKKGTLLGVVQGVFLENTKGGLLGIIKGDSKATNPVTKKPYNWVKIKLADAVYNDIQKNQRNFITRDLFKNPNVYVFVREDAIKL
jgi:hypothetical protein